MLKPKECCNQDCAKIFYVEKERLPMMLECTFCIEKRELRNENTNIN